MTTDGRVAELCEKWRVRPEHATSTPTSRVVFGTRDGRPVVLKVVIDPHEEWNVGTVISAFAGHGVVRALGHVPGAVLLEPVRPGTPLSMLVDAGQDRAATEVVASVIEAMLEITPDTVGLPTAESWAVAYDWYLDRGEARSPPSSCGARERPTSPCAARRVP